MEKISIIVPIYKVEQYLGRCVDSILAQTYKNLEVILVDDGSPDSCGAMCEEYAMRDSRIRVVHKENGGLADARNAGIDIATGDYLGFVDSDDYIAPDMYEVLLGRIKGDDSDLALCSFRYVGSISEKQKKRNDQRRTNNGVLSKSEILSVFMNDGCYMVAWNKLYKRELFSHIRYPKGKLHEDEFVIHHIYGMCERVSCVEKQMYFYEQRSTSIMGVAFDAKRLDAAEAMLDRASYALDKKLMSLCFNSVERYVNVLAAAHSQAEKHDKAVRERIKELKHIYGRLFKRLKTQNIGSKRKIRITEIYIDPYLAWQRTRITKKLKSKAKRLTDAHRTSSQIKRYAASVRNCDWLLADTPTHRNLGDHAIVMAEQQFVKELRPRDTILELTADDIDSRERRYAEFTPEKCVLLIPGGGFLGSIWPKEEYRFRRILQEFDKNRVIVFPQTVTFEMDTPEGRAFFEESKQVYSAHKDLTLFVREKKSYDFMREHMPEVKCFLVPDIVTILKTASETGKRQGMLLCMRSDVERNITDADYRRIYDMCEKKFPGEIKITDTMADHKIMPDARAAEVNKKLDEFAKAKLVVTDRLHGMVFAAITNTPCIAMGNINGKVKGVYEWIKGNAYIRYIDSIEDFQTVLDGLDIDIAYTFNRDQVNSSFGALADIIKGDN